MKHVEMRNTGFATKNSMETYWKLKKRQYMNYKNRPGDFNQRRI